MPLPTPGETEKERDFISRCVSKLSEDGEGGDQKQRVAMCYSRWREKHPGAKKPPSAKSSAKSVRRQQRHQRKAAMRDLPAELLIGAEGPVAIQARSSDKPESPRAFSMLAYSGGKLEIGGWNHPVVVAVEGMDVSRLPKIRLEHDSTKRVGHATEAAKENNSLQVSGLISSTSAAAQEVVADADRGYPWQASIGAMPMRGHVRFVPAGKTANANGRTFDGPLYLVNRSVLKEVSFVDLGGDPDATASVAATLRNEDIPMTLQQFIAAKGLDGDNLTENELKLIQAWQGDLQAQDDDDEEEKKKAAEAQAEDEEEEEEEEKESSASASAIKTRIAEIKYIDQISAVCAKYNHPQWQGQPLEAVALQERWDPTKTELEALRISRAMPMGGNGDGASSVAGVSSNDVVAAAMAVYYGAMDERTAGRMFGEKAMDQATSAPLRNMTLHRIMYDTIHAAGMSHPPGQTDDGFVRKALEADAKIQAASGFAAIHLSGTLSNLANKNLVASFTAVDAVMPKISRARTVNDFKLHTSYRMVGIGRFTVVGPDGHIKAIELSESTYQQRVETHGALLSLTRQDLRNDDLGAFNALTTLLGRQAAIGLDRIGVGKLLENPTMPDGTPFFDATRGNALAAGAASELAIPGLTEAERLLMEITDENGDPCLITADLLLTSTAQAVTATNLMTESKLMGGADPNELNINPHAGKWTPVASPYINSQGLTNSSDTAWWLFANPAGMAVLETAYLDGRQTPIIESSQTDFQTLGMQWRSYWDIGVALMEHRAGVYSPGA